jgi:hypothetical protein
MDEGTRGLLILLGFCLLAAYGHFGRSSLAQAIRDLLWPEDLDEGGPDGR